MCAGLEDETSQLNAFWLEKKQSVLGCVMLFSPQVYIGIDLTQGRKTIYYAALDDQLDLIARAQGDINNVMTFLAGQQQALVGIHGPARPNMAILVDADRRNQYLIPMGKGRPGNMRVAEYILRKNKLTTYRTPEQLEDAPAWMRASFKFYERLSEIDYQPYQAESAGGNQYLEVIPELGFRTWSEGKMLSPNTLYGRIQRQLILYEQGVNLPDPMTFFEEVTRFRIKQGIIPEEMVLLAPNLSALAAALMAYRAEKDLEQFTFVGIPEESQICVPRQLIRTAE